VTEFIDGCPLDEYCEREQLGRRDRVELIGSVAEALHDLHMHGVIHRDIKPSNVLVDAGRRPFIVDLGLAVLADADPGHTITTDGTPIGSPAFMSPEQAQGKRAAISALSDVYSLGATAYLLLTGETPHDMQTTLHEAIRRVAQDPSRLPRDLQPGLPKPLAAVLTKCIARSPADRYTSARALSEDLHRFLVGDPVDAQPASGVARLSRTVARHPILTTAAMCLIIAIATTLMTVAAVHWLNARPYRTRIVEGGQSAFLVSRTDNILHEWDTGREGGIIIAELAEGDRSVIVVGTAHSAQQSHAGELCFYDLGRLDQPFYASGTHDIGALMPEPISTIEGTYLSLAWADVVDVFPDRPGAEVVAVHRHSPHSANVIRVYDLTGEVLYEVWHDGHVKDAVWCPNRRLLVCAALSSEATWADRGIGSGAFPRPPVVVFALRPEEAEIHRAWIHTPGGLGTFQPVWHRAVLPAELADRIAAEPYKIDRPGDPAVRSSVVEFTIRSAQDQSATLNFVIHLDGYELIDRRFPSDRYDTIVLPDWREFEIAPLPPIQREAAPDNPSKP
jgi:hypothetical protein